METWLLVLITAFTGQSYGHPVGAGGLSTEILNFSSKESCEAAGKSILSEVKRKGRMKIDTTGKYVAMIPTDPDRHWIATNVKVQVSCVKVVK